MPNEDIRKYAKIHNVFIWEIAEFFGISEMSIYRKWRKPLSNNQRRTYKDAIDRISKNKEEKW